MTELGLVLLILYLIEGFAWPPLGSVAYSRRPWGGFAARRPRQLRTGARRGALPPEPWLPGLERFVAHVWPLALSPAGVCLPSAGEHLGEAAVGSSAELRWEAAESVGVKGSRLTFGTRPPVETGSARAARYLAGLLRRIGRRPPAERETSIREAIAENFNAAIVRERLEGVRASLAYGAVLAWLLVANIFVTGPLLADTLGRARVWPAWVAIHVALSVVAVRVFFRAARRLGDLAPEGRLETAFMLVLYPPATARFLEALTPHLLTGLDPLAAAAALLGREAFVRAAQDRLGKLRATGTGNEIEDWFHSTVREQILALVEREGPGVAKVLAAPPRHPDSGAFCPGCRTQYRVGVQCCADCSNVMLVAY